MQNLKLKDIDAIETTYSGIDRVAIPKADGSGDALFIDSNNITAQLLESLDPDFVAQNIKKDIDLFGRIGTLKGNETELVIEGTFVLASDTTSYTITIPQTELDEWEEKFPDKRITLRSFFCECEYDVHTSYSNRILYIAAFNASNPLGDPRSNYSIAVSLLRKIGSTNLPLDKAGVFATSSTFIGDSPLTYITKTLKISTSGDMLAGDTWNYRAVFDAIGA